MMLSSSASISYIVLLLITTGGVSSTELLSCLDHDGNPVDWFVIYKLPKLDLKTSELAPTGNSYLYLTSASLSKGWTWSYDAVNSTSTLFYRTLEPYYKSVSDVMWVLYNDQTDSHLADGGGHTKGVVAASKNGGYWLIHSVPHYPPLRSQGYSYPETGLKFGQSALCVTLSPNDLRTVGVALKYNGPDVYEYVGERDSMLTGLYPELSEAARGTLIDQPPWYVVSNLTTRGGTSFTVFAKSKRFGKDLYDLVATNLESDLYTETWLHERGDLPSNCQNKFTVQNVKMVAIDEDTQFRSTDDHSKWAVTTSKSWTCIGDINRAESQEKRGGGTVCNYNKNLWKNYYKLVKEVEPCPKMKHVF